MSFKVGQRWISNTESQLGLGIIAEIQARQLSVSFPAAAETRIYALDNAPLSRIIYKKGDEITTQDELKLEVMTVNEHQGLMFYTGLTEDGKEHQIIELDLNSFIKLNTPKQRLLNGLLDKHYAFQLRINTLHHLSRLQQSPVRGLLGSRTNHLPHQVYITQEVAQRHAPRVLLADEVGLGKTIEAGMIIRHQLQTGRASRVLIVVPDSLIHQWLVEMIRRFSLFFSIFDQSRYEQRYNHEEYDQEEIASTVLIDNLFEREQLVICSIDFLLQNKEAQTEAIEAQWDLLVIDEAHHLQWNEELASPEYALVEKLASTSKGLLLLTATPEQVGLESHFARLRLLDPSRFHSLNAFKEEEQNYQAVNQLVQQLTSYPEDTCTQDLTPELKEQLNRYLPDDPQSLQNAIKSLLDRHGTGRVLFRNTRAAIQGFPARKLQAYPLERPDIYDNFANHLHPEMQTTLWLVRDPRVEWLTKHIEALFPHKILIICAHAKTALALEQHLKIKTGIRAAAFHEGLSIIERDRAAAYFAEEEQGAQVLICSEIGSEGRNFQFAHHLVLFDLPLNPDLVEQRIGRLDRIGQLHEITIHTPYLVDTAQESLFRWYHEGINLFEKSCSIGFSIFKQFEQTLSEVLNGEKNKLDSLIEETKQYTEAITQKLHEGRDRLMELNSCSQPKAQATIEAIEAEENALLLEEYMVQVFQEYGIDHDYHSEQTEILFPSSHMKSSHFPGLKDEGMTVTYSRAKALHREDITFLSWENPMVSESMEMIIDSEVGNATMASISIKSIPVGTLFLEAFYTVNCAAPKSLQLDRFLPLTPIRILVDITGKDLTKVLDYSQLNKISKPMKQHLAHPIIKQIQQPVEQLLAKSQCLAEDQKELTVREAKAKMCKNLNEELLRLEALKQVNPNIREEELSFIRQLISKGEAYLGKSMLKLQAIRVIINK